MDPLPNLSGMARSLAVALVSGQSFVLLVDYLRSEERAQPAFELARRFQLDSSLTVATFCPCGDRVENSCLCRLDSIYDRLGSLVPEGSLWARARWIETLPENLEGRMATARARVGNSLGYQVDSDARALLRRFYSALSGADFQQLETVAAAVAAVDGETTITAAHVLEARKFQAPAFAAKVLRREFF